MKKEQESKDEEDSEDLKELEEFEDENLEDEELEDEQELNSEQFLEFLQKKVKAPVLEESEVVSNTPIILEQELLDAPGQEKKNKAGEFDYSVSNQNTEEPKYINTENTERGEMLPPSLPPTDLANLGKDNSWNSPTFIENRPADSRVSSSSIEKYTLPNKDALEKATKKNPMKFERPEVRYKPSI